MCEFCTKHGDGQVWFRNAANYGNDLMADLNRRKYVQKFLEETIGQGIISLGRLETIYRKKQCLPTRLVDKMVEKAKDEHFGQVVTIEDVREIVLKAATVVRMPCACRWAAEKKENRCCYSVSYSADVWYHDLEMSYFGFAQSEGLEHLSREEAIAQMEEVEKSGAVHTIWTMMTPFIGAICNCQPEDCLGLRTLSLDVETMFRGEQTARVDGELCNGCGLCAERCHFKAISSQQSAGEYKAVVDLCKCYGCGLCRGHCPQEALTMVDRAEYVYNY